MLVNKHLHDTFQLVAHRRKVVKYQPLGGEASPGCLLRWLARPVILRNIRELKILGPEHPIWRRINDARGIHATAVINPADAFDWNPLIKLVETASRLETVEFDFGGANFPSVLLRALEKAHPRVNLRIWSYYRHEAEDHTSPDERALAVSPILRSIKAVIWSPFRRLPLDLRLAAFQRIVSNAPKLTSATVILGGHIRHHSAESLADEKDAELKFFTENKRPNRSLRSLTLDGFSLCKETLEEWGKFVSLPDLTNLKISRGASDPSYFESAAGLLPNLKHVSLNLAAAYFIEDNLGLVEGYLKSCASLTSLSLWSWHAQVSMETILKHGPTLKSLQLHEREHPDWPPRRLLSVEEMARIRTACPHLEEITFDMTREDENWDKDLELHRGMFDELKKFGKQLGKVQIYLDLGLAAMIAIEQDDSLDDELDINDEMDEDEVVEDGDGDGDGDADLQALQDNATPEQTPHQSFFPCDRKGMQEHGEAMWKMLFGGPDRFGSRQLEIKWGEWERKTHGPASDWAQWESENKARVLVRPHERDDRSHEPVCTVFGGKEPVEDELSDAGDDWVPAP